MDIKFKESNERPDLDILFVGGVFPKEQEEEIFNKSKGNVQYAANGFQWSLIKGFDENLQKPVRIMNEMFIGGFPLNYRDAIIKGKEFSHTEDAIDVNLGFINISGIKQLCRPFGEKRFLREWAMDNSERKKAVIIYSLNPRFIRIAKQLKKVNENIFICVTVNDLPNYIMMGKIGILKKIWKEINNFRVTKWLKLVDGYILITKQMAEYLKITSKPHVIVEALIEPDIIKPCETDDSANEMRRIVYTGTLTAKYGILNLLEAFESIKGENYRLIICGAGETEDRIVEKAIKDKRIEYRGVLKQSEIKDIQQSATVLVNPRQDKGEYTKYSFPIKTIEYLLAGVPVVCYKLEGIPHEYDEYLCYIKDDTVKSLAEGIERLCSLNIEERLRIGKRNREFVLKYKNNIVQTKKIIDMIIDHS